MALNIHVALEEGPPDKERSYKVLRIAVVSGRSVYPLLHVGK